jgi:hypothetical protein
MARKKIRPLGDILLDIEPYLDELMDHNLQWGDAFALLKSHLEIHHPGAQETYMNGTHPEFYYGPKEKYAKSARSTPAPGRRKRVRRG